MAKSKCLQGPELRQLQKAEKRNRAAAECVVLQLMVKRVGRAAPMRSLGDSILALGDIDAGLADFEPAVLDDDHRTDLSVQEQ